MDIPGNPEERLRVEIETVLGAFIRGGWASSYTMDPEPAVVWTDLGRMRVLQLIAIDGEIAPGGDMWTPLLGVCHALRPDAGEGLGN